MILIYSHQRATWTPADGASWIADTLTNRDPSDRAQLAWPAATLSVDLGATFDHEVQLGGLALLNTTLPTTATVAVNGRRSGDSSYTYALASATAVAALPGGGTGVVLDFGAAVDPVVAAQITIAYPTAPAAGTVALGELATGPAVRPWIQTGWESGDVDPSKTSRTLGSVPHRVTRAGYRTLTVTPIYADTNETVGTGLTGGTNWQTLRRILRADPYVVAAPLMRPQSNMNATVVYGIVTRLPSVTSLPGPNYQPNQLEIEEVPG